MKALDLFCKDVLNYGNKMPEQAAKELFPEWAKKGLNWRA